MQVLGNLEIMGDGNDERQGSTPSGVNSPERTDFRLRSGAHAMVSMPRRGRPARQGFGDFPERSQFRLRSYEFLIVPPPGAGGSARRGFDDFPERSQFRPLSESPTGSLGRTTFGVPGGQGRAAGKPPVRTDGSRPGGSPAARPRSPKGKSSAGFRITRTHAPHGRIRVGRVGRACGTQVIGILWVALR